ncbi:MULTISPECIES: DUF3370 family protein [unclassified Streptomyces]|uniref:DUF3370 family protein n=1 Tax=unclassified Streptomyces TaxID=2593676 RepID=UPI0035E17ABA
MSLVPGRRRLLLAAPAALAAALTARTTAHAEPSSGTDQLSGASVPGTTITEGQWTPGTPTAPGPTVARELLRPLPGSMAGPELVVSNNPETVTGPGWLMQHARTTSTRGGSARALSGTFPLYLYHQNSTGGTAWLHVLVSNPGTSTVTVSARGSAWTNADKPLVQDPARRAGTGPCYATSADWVTGSLRSYLSPTSVGSKKVVEAARIPMTGSILDGLLEITASGGVYTYTVVTTDGSLTTAINLSQTDGAAAPGNIIGQTETTYGREAGVYGGSRWSTGRTTIDVPAAGSHLGLALNTTVRQVAALDQTVPATAALRDSSQRSWGNYGARYSIELALRNPSAQPRTARLVFGSNVTGSTDVPGNTWNGAMAVSVDGATAGIQTVYVRPTAPRDTIGTYALPAGTTRTVTLDFVVPGLITAGSQLLLESVAG